MVYYALRHAHEFNITPDITDDELYTVYKKVQHEVNKMHARNYIRKRTAQKKLNKLNNNL